MEPLEHRTIEKVTARLVPFLILCFFVAYLDRVNVSFAALTRQGGAVPARWRRARIFFLAYFLSRCRETVQGTVGARKWIARSCSPGGVISGGIASSGGNISTSGVCWDREAGSSRASSSPDRCGSSRLPRHESSGTSWPRLLCHRDRRPRLRVAAGAGRIYGHEVEWSVHHGSDAGLILSGSCSFI